MMSYRGFGKHQTVKCGSHYGCSDKTVPYDWYQVHVSGPLGEVFEWCEENFVDDKWCCGPLALDFYFEDDEDAMAFKLRWL